MVFKRNALTPLADGMSQFMERTNFLRPTAVLKWYRMERIRIQQMENLLCKILQSF